MRNKLYILLYSLIALLTSCNKEEDNTPIQEDVNNTYPFIENNADLYTEQMDNKIPWDAWINDVTLPIEFINEIVKRIYNKPLLLAVSLLNTDRNDLAEDFNEVIPKYPNLNNIATANVYFKHIAIKQNRIYI
ncbi:hypothetical protein [Maribacter sp.]|uniref:hypothetical protein n=1 Tax=Maribacter sp. TaxID=1897614 RepID=UPI0025BEA3AD|nr:hypothetical protein [Maribacter sp.]